MPSSPQSIIKKVDKALRSITPLDRVMWKRTVTRTGGDALLGRYTSTTHVDVLLDPQPYFQPLGTLIQVMSRREDIPILSGGTQVFASDWKALISSSAMNDAELANPDVFLILKDSSGHEESFKVISITNIAMKGMTMVYEVIFRSVAR